MAKYTVAKAFLDIDGITKQPGWQVELSLDRALRLVRWGFIVGPVYQPVPPEPWQAIHGTARRLTSREENVAGVASAIALANELRTLLNEHFADVTEHTAVGAPDVADVITEPAAVSLPTLLTLTAQMLANYAAHHADALLLANWVYHAAQGTDYSLVSALAPANLQECITRLNDLKDKYDDHDADNVAHGAAGLYPTTLADADYGPVIRVPVRGALANDLLTWGILDAGTGTVVGVRGIPGNDRIDFEFDADPQNDCIISYLLTRKLP